MEDLLNLSLEDVEAADNDFKPIPAGEYPAFVNSAEITTSRNGHRMLKLEIEIFGEKYTGRKLWENLLCFEYPANPVVVEIAKSKLKSLLIAINHPNPDFLKELDELYGKEFIVKIKVEKDSTYGETNKIVGYRPFEQPQLQATGTDSVTASMQESKQEPLPWEK